MGFSGESVGEIMENHPRMISFQGDTCKIRKQGCPNSKPWEILRKAADFEYRWLLHGLWIVIVKVDREIASALCGSGIWRRE